MDFEVALTSVFSNQVLFNVLEFLPEIVGNESYNYLYLYQTINTTGKSLYFSNQPNDDTNGEFHIFLDQIAGFWIWDIIHLYNRGRLYKLDLLHHCTT
eukprot:UN12560